MNKQQADLLDRITVKGGMLGGKPTIRGLRFPVKDVLELLSDGMTWEEILDEHPVLEKDDIRAALLFAIMKMDGKISLNASAA